MTENGGKTRTRMIRFSPSKQLMSVDLPEPTGPTNLGWNDKKFLSRKKKCEDVLTGKVGSEGEGKDKGEGRSEFMTDIGEKFDLHHVQFM